MGNDEETMSFRLSEKDIPSANVNMNTPRRDNNHGNINNENNNPNGSNYLPELEESPSHVPTQAVSGELQLDEIPVDWDENDPMHPHSMSKARRWTIVLIMCFGSLCV